MKISRPHRSRTFPLGIDVGTHHVRVALVERDATNAPRLIAVATRPTGDDLAAIINDAIGDLPTNERRCVLGIGMPDSILRTLTFPHMSRAERERAAMHGRWQ